jgi:hypothetical protein
MGSNNNSNQPAATQQPATQQAQPTQPASNQPQQWSSTTGYGPNANPSGSDPKGIGQNQSQYQQSRYENQQGPLANQAAYNYGNASTLNNADYNNVMGGYNQFLGGGSGQSYGQPQQSQQSGQPSPSQQAGSQGGPPQIQGTTFDPNVIGQFLQWQATQPGADPILQTPGGIQYYTQQILSKPDGLSSSNMDYWANKATLASYGGAVGAGGGGGGGGGNTLSSFQQMNPQAIGAINSALGGYQGFANTGGYSADDIANLRARGTAPVRAAYGVAQDAMARQSALQGGYAPNAIAAQSQLARNQSQAMSDAMQNVNAGIVNQRNQNQLAGLAGLGQTGTAYGNLGFNYSQLGQQGVLGALQGQTSMYGASPGMANTFGNQAISLTGQGGQFGNELYSNDINNQKAPGMIQNTLNTVGNIANTAGNVAKPLVDYFGNNNTGNNTGQSGSTAPYDPNAVYGPTTPDWANIDPSTGYPYQG